MKNLLVYGTLQVKRPSDGELLGKIDVARLDGRDRIIATRAKRSVWCLADVPGGDAAQEFADIDAAAAWLAAHPGLPDLARLDPALRVLDGALARVVWTAPDGTFIAFVERGHTRTSWLNGIGGLWRPNGNRPVQIGSLRRRDGHWTVSTMTPPVQHQHFRKPSLALEALAALSLGPEASAHERLAFAQARPKRKAAFAPLADTLHRRDPRHAAITKTPVLRPDRANTAAAETA